jgi:repressor LexA
MNRKNDERMMEIYRFITDFIDENGYSPSTAVICDRLALGKATVSKFVCRLIESGMLERSGRYGLCATGMNGPKISIPIVGRVACGKPKPAIEDIDGYLTVDRHLIGSGDFFALTADGESMIDAGICDGDIVYVRRQSYADEGDIVVAMVPDEITGERTATLKRFFRDEKNSRFILRPENPTMNDILVDEVEIVGVAVRLLKVLKK